MSEKNNKKHWYTRWWAIILFIIVLIIILGNLGKNSPTKQNPSINNSQNSSTTSSQKNTQDSQVFKIGDEIKIGDTILTVNKVNKDWHSSNEFDTPSNPNDGYVVVTITLKNIGNDNLDLSGLTDFTLKDSKGLIHDMSFGGIGLNRLPSGALAPQGEASGDIVFEVPKDSTSELVLNYEPMFSFQQVVSIELQ